MQPGFTQALLLSVSLLKLSLHLVFQSLQLPVSCASFSNWDACVVAIYIIAFREANIAKLKSGRDWFIKQPRYLCMAAWILLVFIPLPANGRINIVSSTNFISNDFIFPSSSLLKMLRRFRPFSKLLMCTGDSVLIILFFPHLSVNKHSGY